MGSFVWDLLQIVNASATTTSAQQVQVCSVSKFAEPLHSVPLAAPVQLCSKYRMNALFCLFKEKNQQMLKCHPETALR